MIAPTPALRPKTFLWLEITGKCPLECIHCYADSGPDGSHGTMTTGDWISVIDDAASVGITTVQMIGGEPTTRRDLDKLVKAALERDLKVEIFSNLAHVREELWKVFSLPGVSLATSWYSDDPAEHERITGRDTHAHTAANISRAVELGISVRVGLVDVLDGQRTTHAVQALQALGVQPSRVGVDRFRQFGRGRVPKLSELCGRCGNGRAAIGPNGDVWPCIMSRWIIVGNVHTAPLAELLQAAVVPAYSAQCAPESCEPNCMPAITCRPADGPCDPTHGVTVEGGDVAAACMPSCAPACAPNAWCGPLEERTDAAHVTGPHACTPSCQPVLCGPSCGPGSHCGPTCGPGYCGP